MHWDVREAALIPALKVDENAKREASMMADELDHHLQPYMGRYSVEGSGLDCKSSV